jgi:hypothetical protein
VNAPLGEAPRLKAIARDCSHRKTDFRTNHV